MVMIWVYALLSVLIVSFISLIGIFTLGIKESILRKILIFMVSFAAGALLGDAFIHLLPEVFESYGFGLNIALYVLCGMAFGLITEKVICWRHCHIPTSETHVHPVAIMNLVGDSIHNFIDGIIIGASYLISIPVGIATTLAVIFHEIPQEIGDFGILLHGNFTKSKALLANFLTSLTAILGAVLALVVGHLTEKITLFLIPFAAGTFIYIAAADLIPEMHKGVFDLKNAIMQIFFFSLGVFIMVLLLILE